MTPGEALRGVRPADAGAMQCAVARRLTPTMPPGSPGPAGEVNETAEAAVLVLAVILTAGAAGALPDA